jgi:transposase
VANPGIANLAKLARQALSDEDALPTCGHATLEVPVRPIMTLSEEITKLDRKRLAWHADSEARRRLTAIPGLGIFTATAIAATVIAPDQLRSGRQFAAWLGLTLQQHSTGGKTQLGGISKQGNRYRRLLVVGATAVSRHTRDKPTPVTRIVPVRSPTNWRVSRGWF